MISSVSTLRKQRANSKFGKVKQSQWPTSSDETLPLDGYRSLPNSLDPKNSNRCACPLEYFTVKLQHWMPACQREFLLLKMEPRVEQVSFL